MGSVAEFNSLEFRLEGAVKTGPFLARAQPLKIGLFTSLIALFL